MIRCIRTLTVQSWQSVPLGSDLHNSKAAASDSDSKTEDALCSPGLKPGATDLADNYMEIQHARSICAVCAAGQTHSSALHDSWVRCHCAAA